MDRNQAPSVSVMVGAVIASVKIEASKNVPFLVPAPASRSSAQQENQEISKSLTSAELGSGSAELG